MSESAYIKTEREENMQQLPSAVIIGGGPAGLTAAVELARAGFRVTLLEAGSRFGGISCTVEHAGNRMDIGGHRFFTKEERVARWWAEMLPPEGANAEHPDEVMLQRDRVSRIYFNHHFFDYPVSLSLDTLRGMGLITSFRAGFSYLHSAVRKLPETSLENFYINRFGRVLYSMFFESYTEKVWGRHPSQLSADWGAQRVKGLSVRAVLGHAWNRLWNRQDRRQETSLIEKFSYPKYGPGQLWEKAAREAEKAGAKLYLNSPVTEIRAQDGRIVSVTARIEGETCVLTADRFISTMPLKELLASLQGAVIPPAVLESAQALPYRDFVTVGILVNELSVKDKKTGGRIPDCWIYVQDKSVRLGRVQVFNNWSPYLVKDPENTVWLGLEYFCREGDGLWSLSDEKMLALAVGELRAIGLIREQPVLTSHVERVKKAYPAYFDGYAGMDCIRAYLDSFPNLYCAGRNGQHRYNNMDHSMATAFACCDAILDRGGREEIWNVNTEREYHEQKNVPDGKRR